MEELLICASRTLPTKPAMRPAPRPCISTNKKVIIFMSLPEYLLDRSRRRTHAARERSSATWVVISESTSVMEPRAAPGRTQGLLSGKLPFPTMELADDSEASASVGLGGHYEQPQLQTRSTAGLLRQIKTSPNIMADYTLYSYFRSSCSARVRIVLNLKNIDYDTVPVHLLKDEQLSDAHKALNPSASVPLLVRKGGSFKIEQSVAAIEYLEEVHPQNPILPPLSNPEARAAVRTLALIVAADIQPVTNLRIMRRVKALGGAAEEWNKDLMTAGLQAYETIAKEWAGKYSVGDDITLADACLLPAYWNAERFGVDLAAFPVIKKIVEGLSQHPAVVKAHWRNQPDTPEDLREKPAGSGQ
ncbi:putative glutathione S-transferase [Cladobotryum mycophilum]|uniref:Glutathione S-transferase n=1 Tax=Cladobotryum mycophilum TaxID=491253 RepID=A0ABR0SCJ9_9HYPO